MVRAAILADYRNLELSTRMLAERPDLVAALHSPEGDDAVRSWAQRSRRFGGDAAVEIYNAGGQLIERVGNPAQYRLDGPTKAQLVRDALQGRDGLVVDDNEGGLTLRAAAPVLARHRIVGGVIAEQRIDADYLGLLASRVGLSVNLVTSGRELVMTSKAADTAWLRKLGGSLLNGASGTVNLEGRQDVSLLPLALTEDPIAIAVMMPNDRAYHALSDSTGSFAAVVLFTIMATIAAGLYLTRYLIQPIKLLTGRAEELSLRFAGRPAVRRGDELDSLVASFEAMTSALLSHSDRLARAHKSELQNSLELQHQYAQMRLLRGLAAVANEGGTVESTLERALHEIGAYLDWPLGRVALQQERAADSALPPRSIWFSRDADRFAVFVDASNRTADHAVARSPDWPRLSFRHTALGFRLVADVRMEPPGRGARRRTADRNRDSGDRARPRHGLHRILLRPPRRGDQRTAGAARVHRRRAVTRR